MPEPDPDLPQMLGAAFTAFETIRQSARASEDRDRALFPAFISAATAAANGRDALLQATAVSADAGLPPGVNQPTPAASPNEAADAIAASAAVLADWLDKAAGQATTPHDQDACQDAAAAARHIHELMAACEPHSR
jgi:hypothetical protein